MVASVVYPSQDPITKTLRSFQVDVLPVAVGLVLDDGPALELGEGAVAGGHDEAVAGFPNRRLHHVCEPHAALARAGEFDGHAYPGIARIGVVIEYGDRPVQQVLAGGVLQPGPVERVLGQHGLVVDADALHFDVVSHDRDHGRLLPRKRNVTHHILKQLPNLSRGGGRCHARGRVQRIHDGRHSRHPAFGNGHSAQASWYEHRFDPP